MPREARKGCWIPGTGDYNPMHMGVGNQTLVFCQGSVSLNH